MESESKLESILIADKIVFKPKLARRDKEVHYTPIKEILHQEDIIIAYMYICNECGTSNNIKQM
jgi:hypothetical protein